jgi:hypothetical protein
MRQGKSKGEGEVEGEGEMAAGMFMLSSSRSRKRTLGRHGRHIHLVADAGRPDLSPGPRLGCRGAEGPLNACTRLEKHAPPRLHQTSLRAKVERRQPLFDVVGLINISRLALGIPSECISSRSLSRASKGTLPHQAEYLTDWHPPDLLVPRQLQGPNRH